MRLNILFDFFKALNVSFNILKSVDLFIYATSSNVNYFIINIIYLKKYTVYQFYLAYLFHKNSSKGKNIKIIEGETGIMKKIVQTSLLTAFVILVTTSFSYAQFSVTGNDNFPFFHLGCLIIGGLIIISLKRKYAQLYMSEAIGSFALYTVLVALFTIPVVDALKTLIN